MTYSDPQILGSGGAKPHGTRTTTDFAVLIERLRLALAATLVVGLVAMAAFGGGHSAQAPDVQSDTANGDSATEAGPAFDGRGKWGGYAR